MIVLIRTHHADMVTVNRLLAGLPLGQEIRKSQEKLKKITKVGKKRGVLKKS